ncbi:MAG: hypothetical protein ABI263_07075 [Gelidibacter sp.]
MSLCVVLFIYSCKEENKIPENFDYGTVENGVYANDFFNFELSFDKDWSVQSKDQMAEMTKKGQDLITGKNELLKKNLKASQVNVAELFAVFKFPVGTGSVYNPSLIINAENLKGFPDVRKPKDYMDAVRSLLDEAPMKLIYKEQHYSKIIGGKEFVSMEIYNQDYNVSQEYFSTIQKGFAIIMVISYNDDAQKEELYKIIDNLKFK